MAVDGSAHTIFKGLEVKMFYAKKIGKNKLIHRKKKSDDYMYWFVYLSRNVILCLFYASEQAKV
jgi:hypothetical protein